MNHDERRTTRQPVGVNNQRQTRTSTLHRIDRHTTTVSPSGGSTRGAKGGCKTYCGVLSAIHPTAVGCAAEG